MTLWMIERKTFQTLSHDDDDDDNREELPGTTDTEDNSDGILDKEKRQITLMAKPDPLPRQGWGGQ